MECFPAQPASRLGDDGLEHMVSTKSTPLLRMSSSLQRRPLMAVNAEITDASRELVRSISNLQSPTFVKRDTSSVATVNVGAALEDGMQPVGRAFQRLSSQRMDSFRMLPTIPHNQEAQHGVVLPERTSSIVTSTVSKPHLTRLSSWTEVS